MSGQIAYDESKVNDNALTQLNRTIDYLKEAVSNLEGINAGDLEINLETDMIKSNINENINTVTQIKFEIMTILDEYLQAENENKQLIDEILGDIPDNEEKISDEKTPLFDKLLDIGKRFLTTPMEKQDNMDVQSDTIAIDDTIEYVKTLAGKLIPLIPHGFQNDDPIKTTYNYGKSGSNVFKGACGLYAGLINPRYLLGGAEIALETWLKIQRGVSDGGSDGSLYGSIAQSMEFCRIYNFRKI